MIRKKIKNVILAKGWEASGRTMNIPDVGIIRPIDFSDSKIRRENLYTNQYHFTKNGFEVLIREKRPNIGIQFLYQIRSKIPNGPPFVTKQKINSPLIARTNTIWNTMFFTHGKTPPEELNAMVDFRSCEFDGLRYNNSLKLNETQQNLKTERDMTTSHILLFIKFKKAIKEFNEILSDQ